MERCSALSHHGNRFANTFESSQRLWWQSTRRGQPPQERPQASRAIWADFEIRPISLVQDQIEQVFINILINAIDAISDDNKDLKKIFIYTDIINDNLIITFEDTGIGIYEEDISKIFEPFFTTKEEGKGTGLGLWITYGIIKSFQGDIKVESTKGVGSKFILTLPVNK